MSTRLHAGNIPSMVAAADFEAMFSLFGSVDDVESACDAGTSNGFARVAMSRSIDAVAAIGRIDFTPLARRTLADSVLRANNP